MNACIRASAILRAVLPFLLLYCLGTSGLLHASADCTTITLTRSTQIKWPINTGHKNELDHQLEKAGTYRNHPHHTYTCFQLHNTDTVSLDMSIYLDNARMNHAELLTEKNNSAHVSIIGLDHPFQLWSTPSAAAAAFDVHLEPGQSSRHELMIGSQNTFNARIHIMGRQALLKHLSQINYIAGLITGSIFILVIYFLCLSMSSRDLTFFYLAGSTLSVTFMQLSDLGLLYPLWPRALHWNQSSSAFFGILSTLFGCCLARKYLDTRHAMPRIDKGLNLFAWYMLVVAMPISLLLSQQWMLLVFGLPALCFMLFLLYISMRRIQQGFVPARLYLVAYMLPLVAGVSILLMVAGWIPSGSQSHLLPLGGTAIQLILFSLALGERINWLTRESDAARLLTVEARTETEAKRHFLAQVSHEFRTPLIGMIGLCGLLDRKQYQPADLELVDGLQSSANQLLSITNTLLDHARIDAHKWKVDNTTFSLMLMLRDITDRYENIATAKGLSFKVLIEDPIPAWLHGSQDILARMLSELLDNAVKFTATGSITLRVATHKNPSAPGNIYLQLAVEDTGQGVDAQFRHRIFEIFELADSSTTRQAQGSGMGLSLCKKLCHLLQGDIGFENNLPHGSRFWFNLPFETRETENGIKPDAAPPSTQTQERHILVAEDDEALQLILSVTLDKIGVKNYLIFPHGQALLARYEQDPKSVSLLLMDWNMPVMNASEAIKAIREMETARQLTPVPIIVMTAHDTQYDFRSELTPDIRILYKPLSVSVLQQLLTNTTPLPTGDA